MKSQYKNGNYKKSQNFRNEKYSIWTENFTKLSNVLGNAKEKVSETREGNWNYLNGSTERRKPHTKWTEYQSAVGQCQMLKHTHNENTRG